MDVQRFGPPESLGGLGEAEIQALIHDKPAAVADQLRAAARRLHIAKLANDFNARPWRELLDEFRASPLFQVHFEVIEVDGTKHIQTAYREHGYGLKGSASTLFEAIKELDGAVAAIEKFDPADHISRQVTSLVAKKNAEKKRPTGQTRGEKLGEIAAWLKTAGYKESPDKEGLIDRALKLRGWCETDVREAARREGLTRSYRKSTK